MSNRNGRAPSRIRATTRGLLGAVAIVAATASAASAVSVSAVEVTLTKGSGNTGGTSMVEAGDTLTASITSDGDALNNAFSRWFGCRPPALASPFVPGVSNGSTDVCVAAPYSSTNITPTLSNGNTTSTTTFVVPSGTGANGPAGTVLAYQTTLQATADKLWTGQIPVASSATAQPTISTGPLSQSVGAGSTATLSVVATGNDAAANLQAVPVAHALSYSWEKSTDSGQSWTPVAGAASASYTTPALALSDSGIQYRVVVSDNPTIPGQKIGVSTNPAWQTQNYLAWTAPATRTSSAAVLTVVSPPAVPSFVRVTAGNTNALVELAAGSGGVATNSFYVEVVGDATKNCTATVAGGGSCTISGLTNGTSYTFVAKATSAGNISSAFSSASAAVIPDLPPATPGKPIVVVGDGQATVTVTPGSGAGTGTPTSYRAWVPGSNPVKECFVQGSSGSCTITGLSNGTSYTVRTLAFGAGASAPSVLSDPFTPVASAPSPPPDQGSGSGASESSAGGSSSGGSSAGGTSPASAAARSKMRVRARVRGQLTASPAGIVRVPLACPRSVTDGCDADGVLTMTLPGQVRSEADYLVNPLAARAGRQRELGRFTDVEIASGATKVVTVRIDPATFAALRRSRVARVPVTLLTNNALAGAPPVRSVQRIWLAIPSAGRLIAVAG